MIAVFGFVIGVLWGGWTAKKRGGNRLDIAQYAAVHGILLALATLLVSVIAGRYAGL